MSRITPRRMAALAVAGAVLGLAALAAAIAGAGDTGEAAWIRAQLAKSRSPRGK